MCGEGMADEPVKNQKALESVNCNEVQVLHWQNRGNEEACVDFTVRGKVNTTT